MALKIKLDINKLPPYAKIIIAVVPALIIIIAVYIIFISPKNKEIKSYEIKISKQENEIARSQLKAEKLPELSAENEKLRRKLNALKEQLPEEKEVSDLLRQVSDLALRSGLKILFWRPQAKSTHPSGIVYQIPVSISVEGSYHNLGYFFSSLTKLNRIVNISDIKLAEPKPEKDGVLLKISFITTTFSAIPEGESGTK
jgi:type IV pilus assembly protein PilO